MVSAMVMASSWSWVTWMNVSADLGLDPLELDLHLPPQLEVERTERLVEQQHLGLVDQGPGQGDPLLLATGELGGACRVAVSSTSSSIRCTCVLDVGTPCGGEAEGDVLEDVEVREERVVLEDGVDRPLVGLVEGDVLPSSRSCRR